jgi:retron-type reverse transcriptase
VVLALLCTEPPRVEAELDGKVFHVALGDRVLPQGAPTSPAITNLVCRRLDRRLGGLAQSLGFTYTRYADDLTFSGEHRGKVGRLLKAVRDIVPEEGFVVREDKTRIMHRGRRQEVTGVSVNHAVAVPRAERRLLRAILRNAQKAGSLASQNRAQHAKFRQHLTGRIAWVAMVEPRHAAPLLEMLQSIPD